MKIETRFNAGDEVFYKEGDEIKQGKISYIKIAIVDLFNGVRNFVEINYFVKVDGVKVKCLFQDRVFKTKEELVSCYDL